MTTYISVLRGINVGQKTIKMDALKKMYEALNLGSVQTYIQSGNVIFQAKEKQKDLEQKISLQIKNEFGFEVPVIVLSIEELTQIIKNNPFVTDTTKEAAYLHVTLLASTPANIDLEIINQKRLEGEDFLIAERAVYLYCPNGYGITKLGNTFFENKLKVKATTRNWKTANELLKIAAKVQQAIPNT